MSEVFKTVGEAVGAIAYAFTHKTPRVANTPFTRPDNITIYSALDAIHPALGSALEFPDVAEPGQATRLVEVSLISDIKPVTTTTTPAKTVSPLKANLFLFNENLSVAPVDNAKFAPTLPNMTKLVGNIAFNGDPITICGDFTIETIKPIDMIIYTSPTSQNLYGVLVAAATYDPKTPKGEFIIQLRFAPDPNFP